MEFKAGIFSNVPERVYRPLSFLNYSSLPYLLQSPAHYIAMLEAPRAQSKEMSFGSAFHSYILEPELFKSEYTVKTIDGRTNKGKQELLVAEASNKKIISEEDFERIEKMDRNLKRHAIAPKFLTDGHAEQVLLFELRASNGNMVKCKGKADYMLSQVVVDLKTTKNSKEDAFNDSIGRYNYHIQGAFYSHAIETLLGEKPDFVFIAVESEPPFAINVIKLSEGDYAKGYQLVYQAVDIYEQAVRTNTWPSYPERILESKTKPWIK